MGAAAWTIIALSMGALLFIAFVWRAVCRMTDLENATKKDRG